MENTWTPRPQPSRKILAAEILASDEMPYPQLQTVYTDMQGRTSTTVWRHELEDGRAK